MTLDRLHTYLHANAGVRARDVVDLDVVTLYLGTAMAASDNVALMREDDDARLAGSLALARARVRERNGTIHVRLIEEVFPRLASAMTPLGLRQVKREPLFVCTPATLLPTSDILGLTFVTLTSESQLHNVQQELDTNERGFDPGFTGFASTDQAERFRSTLVTARAFTAHLNGEAVAAGMFHTPLDGVTQISGIATLAPYRRRGIAATLTTFMTQTAFNAGVDLVYLAAANEPAQRVYERLGFREVGTLLAYDDTISIR